VNDVPVQDAERLKQTPNIRVTTGPENRTILIGMDVASPDLKSDNVAGKNPLADKKVRQALNIAINRQAIQRVVMRGQAQPAGVIIPPFVNGWTAELDKLEQMKLMPGYEREKGEGRPTKKERRKWDDLPW